MAHENLRKARCLLGLTQEQFAKKAEVGRSTLAALEIEPKIMPNLENAIKIAKAAGVSDLDGLRELFLG